MITFVPTPPVVNISKGKILMPKPDKWDNTKFAVLVQDVRLACFDCEARDLMVT